MNIDDFENSKVLHTKIKYIYCLYLDELPIYIGVSNDPKKRWLCHLQNYYGRRVKIPVKGFYSSVDLYVPNFDSQQPDLTLYKELRKKNVDFIRDITIRILEVVKDEDAYSLEKKYIGYCLLKKRIKLLNDCSWVKKFKKENNLE